jgi:hypothetical protein
MSPVTVEFGSRNPIDIPFSVFFWLDLVPLDGRETDNFWAPFNLDGKPILPATPKVKWKSGASRIQIRVAPDDLLWAPTKSSVWPSLRFSRAINPGRYRLLLHVEMIGHKPLESNEIEIIVSE